MSLGSQRKECLSHKLAKGIDIEAEVAKLGATETLDRGIGNSCRPDSGVDALNPTRQHGSLSFNDVIHMDSQLSCQRVGPAPHNRQYILDLVDQTHLSRYKQNHPATFQCCYCPKRFTRSYNLRSHLRTHRDERPFVCSVCGRAFVRPHDRKSHESLHSGEKNYRCGGDLLRGGQWGCGRPFSRASALKRHFRSQSGRMCIKPLRDEESYRSREPLRSLFSTGRSIEIMLA